MAVKDKIEVIAFRTKSKSPDFVKSTKVPCTNHVASKGRCTFRPREKQIEVLFYLMNI